MLMADIEKDLKIEYEVIRSNRKTFALQIKDGRLIVRVPLRARRVDVERFVYSHREWIEEHLEIYRERRALYGEIKPLTEDEMSELGEKAREVIPLKFCNTAVEILFTASEESLQYLTLVNELSIGGKHRGI